MVPHPLNFTDNFGLRIHGPELDYRLKSALIRAAEACFEGTTDEHVINMLQQPPCRPILALEYFYIPELVLEETYRTYTVLHHLCADTVFEDEQRCYGCSESPVADRRPFYHCVGSAGESNGACTNCVFMGKGDEYRLRAEVERETVGDRVIASYIGRKRQGTEDDQAVEGQEDEIGVVNQSEESEEEQEIISGATAGADTA